MKRNNILQGVVIGLVGLTSISFAASSPSLSANPIFIITPTQKAPTVIYPGEVKTAIYNIQNNSKNPFPKLSANGVAGLPKGIKVVGGTCARPTFDLARGKSCTVELEITADELQGAVHSGPDVCNTLAHCVHRSQPTVANRLNIVKGKNSSQTTLSVPATAVIPVNDPTGVSIVVTNLTSSPAINVHADLSGTGWGSNVTSSTCASIPSNGTCTLTLKSTSPTPFIAQSNIPIIGSNVASPPTMALAFSIDGYLVFSVDNNNRMASVVANSDASGPNGIIWSSDVAGNPDFASIWGIAETSTSSSPFPNASQPVGQEATQFAGQQNCNGSTDGYCNAQNVLIYYSAPVTNPTVNPNYYAAGLCHKIASDNSGVVTPGTWYLPAICQLGGGSTCAAQNIADNLYYLGFSIDLRGDKLYWSYTEASDAPFGDAWFKDFNDAGESGTNKAFKGDQLLVRCVRDFNY